MWTEMMNEGAKCETIIPTGREIIYLHVLKEEIKEAILITHVF